VICKTLGIEAVSDELSCAAASELPTTARDNPNRMELSVFMDTILLDWLRDHTQGKGKAGKERVPQDSAIMRFETPLCKETFAFLAKLSEDECFNSAATSNLAPVDSGSLSLRLNIVFQDESVACLMVLSPVFLGF
jgi:hypothetical protein